MPVKIAMLTIYSNHVICVHIYVSNLVCVHVFVRHVDSNVTYSQGITNASYDQFCQQNPQSTQEAIT